MNRITETKYEKLWLVLVMLIIATAGCSHHTMTAAYQDETIYTGVLDIGYEDALDQVGQLGLGILQLADTNNAMTEDQAGQIQPLWALLNDGVIQSDAEREVVAHQVEGVLTESQLSAIQSMHLTNADVLIWMEAHENGVVDAGVSSALTRAILEIVGEGEPETVAVNPGKDAVQTPTPTPEASLETEETRGEEMVNEEPSEILETETITPEPDSEGASSMGDVLLTPTPPQEFNTPIALLAPLTQIRDTDPAPPFSVEITTNFAASNPNLEEGWIYTVGGLVRNDSDQTYSLQAIQVTFYDAEGFHGAFYPYASQGRGRRQGGEYIWHGRTEAEFACLIVAPGQTCPFSVQIAADNMESFMIHPDAAITEWHEAATAEIHNVKVIDDGLGYIRISGSVHNQNAFDIKHVMVTGALLDDTSQWVSFGTVTLLEEVEPGTDANFDLWVEKVRYVDYALYVSAEEDFN